MSYERREDKKNIETALLERIEYHGDTQNRFFEVEIYFAKGKENNAAMTAALENHFGKPDSSQAVDENVELLFWSGQKAEVQAARFTFSRSKVTIKKKKAGQERNAAEDRKNKTDKKMQQEPKSDF